MTQIPQSICSRSTSDMTGHLCSIRASLVTLTMETGRDVSLDHVYMENITPTIGQVIEAIITSQQTRKWMRSGASREMILPSNPAAFQTCLEEAQHLIVEADEQVSQSRTWIEWFEAALNEAEAIPRATAFP